MRKLRYAFLAALLLAVSLMVTASADPLKIRWKVLGGGGTTSTFPGGIKLSGTAVQTAVGDIALPNYSIAQGFWNKTLAPCHRGDADGSGSANISDAVYIINYVFVNGPAPLSACGGDGDGNGYVNISDAVWVIRFVFLIP